MWTMKNLECFVEIQRYLGNNYKDVYNLRSLYLLCQRNFFLPFWAFFHGTLSPVIGLGSAWPPIRIHPVNPLETSCLCTEVLHALVVLLATEIHEFWYFHSSVTEKSTLLGCDIALLGEWFPPFWRNTFPSSWSIQVLEECWILNPWIYRQHFP